MTFIFSLLKLYSLFIVDANRESILVAGGCQVLVDQIARCSDPGEDIYTNERYKCIICGCVLNLATNNGKLVMSH